MIDVHTDANEDGLSSYNSGSRQGLAFSLLLRRGDDLGQSLVSKRDLQQHRFDFWVGGSGR
jgi:hypothetical protein